MREIWIKSSLKYTLNQTKTPKKTLINSITYKRKKNYWISKISKTKKKIYWLFMSHNQKIPKNSWTNSLKKNSKNKF